MSCAGDDLTHLCFISNSGFVSLKCLSVVKCLIHALSAAIVDIHAFFFFGGITHLLLNRARFRN